MWFLQAGSTDYLGRLTTSGAYSELPGAPNHAGRPPNYSSDMTAGADGYLWYTELSGVFVARVSPSTGAIEEIPFTVAQDALTGITTGPDRNIWFSDATANELVKIVW